MGFEANFYGGTNDGTKGPVRRPEVKLKSGAKTWKARVKICHPGVVLIFLFSFGIWKVRFLRQIEGGPRGPSNICCECADFQKLFQLDDFKSVKNDGFVNLSFKEKPPISIKDCASNTGFFVCYCVQPIIVNLWCQMIAQHVPWVVIHGPWSFNSCCCSSEVASKGQKFTFSQVTKGRNSLRLGGINLI